MQDVKLRTSISGTKEITPRQTGALISPPYPDPVLRFLHSLTKLCLFARVRLIWHSSTILEESVRGQCLKPAAAICRLIKWKHLLLMHPACRFDSSWERFLMIYQFDPEFQCHQPWCFSAIRCIRPAARWERAQQLPFSREWNCCLGVLLLSHTGVVKSLITSTFRAQIPKISGNFTLGYCFVKLFGDDNAWILTKEYERNIATDPATYLATDRFIFGRSREHIIFVAWRWLKWILLLPFSFASIYNLWLEATKILP